MEILGFSIVNDEKFNRAVYGAMGANGALHGGVGEGATDEAKLAEYDRLGGLVRKGKNKVKMGCFYDFKSKAPHKKFDVVLEFKDLDGETVEIAEGEEIPVELKAAEIINEKKAVKAMAKVEEIEKKKEESKKKGKKIVDEE